MVPAQNGDYRDGEVVLEVDGCFRGEVVDEVQEVVAESSVCIFICKKSVLNVLSTQ
jgi:hypothetical protein